jgi:hypothetical protein
MQRKNNTIESTMQKQKNTIECKNTKHIESKKTLKTIESTSHSTLYRGTMSIWRVKFSEFVPFVSTGF